MGGVGMLGGGGLAAFGLDRANDAVAHAAAHAEPFKMTVIQPRQATGA